jgi:hypothetical protein
MINFKDKSKKKEVIAILSIFGLFTLNYILWQYSPKGLFSNIVWGCMIIFAITFLITFFGCNKLKKKELIITLASFGVVALIGWQYQHQPPSGLNFDFVGWFALGILYLVLFVNWFWR